MSLGVSVLQILELLLLPRPVRIIDTPQADGEPHHTRNHGDDVRAPVAGQSLGTLPLALTLHDGVVVVDHAVEQVEHVSADDGRQGHAAPVGAEAVDAEGLGDEGREAAKEEPVAEAGQAGNERQVVGVLDGEREDLGDEEDERGDRQAPESRGFQHLD